MSGPIYLDHNATAPVLPEVAEAMARCYAAGWGNPGSQHQMGRAARRALEDARDGIAELLGARVGPGQRDQVVFTGGGTEANNLALCGLAAAQATPDEAGTAGRKLLLSAIEHPSVDRVAHHLASRGWAVDRLPADTSGRVGGEQLQEAITPDTRLVSVMLANNETGVLQPVDQLARMCNERGLPLHTDAAQVIGKMDVDFMRLGPAALSFAAHKFHGPPGVGAVIVRHDIQLQPIIFGGSQEAGLRAGTPAVALVVGMHEALRIWRLQDAARSERMAALRDQFERLLITGYPGAVVVGKNSPRLPHTSNIAFLGIDRQALAMALDQIGVACSTGSACASGSSEPSPVLQAMGCPNEVVTSALRFSLGATTSDAEVAQAAERILNVVNTLRPRRAAQKMATAAPPRDARSIQ